MPQITSAQSNAPVNLSGYWELHYDSRNVPKATLTPKGTLAVQSQAKKTLHAVRYCILAGMPMVMDNEKPIDIEQDSKHIGILAEIVSGPRTIYLDGRQHPDPLTFDPTTVGDSIGHWEGDTLVVDTVGFSDQGVTDLPGGGIRTPTSHLVEIYQLVDGGKRLVVTFTWTDPKIFAKPHTYAYMYYRSAPGYRPGDTDCDASDVLRTNFLENEPKP